MRYHIYQNRNQAQIPGSESCAYLPENGVHMSAYMDAP